MAIAQGAVPFVPLQVKMKINDIVPLRLSAFPSAGNGKGNADARNAAFSPTTELLDLF
jgi:hypothetical protein